MGTADDPASAQRPTFDEAARQVAADLDVQLDRLIETESLRGDAGSALVVPLSGDFGTITKLLIVGIGAGTVADWRAAGAAVARRCGSASRVALVASPALDGLRAFAEGVSLGAYRVRGLLDRGGGGQSERPAPSTGGRVGGSRSDNRALAAAIEQLGLPAGIAGPDTPTGTEGMLRAVVVLGDQAGDLAARAELRAARAVSSAVYIARDLVNTPSLVKSPQWLAERAVQIATAAGLTARVLGPEELAVQGFGGLCAVGRGSPRPPRLVRIEYDSSTSPERDVLSIPLGDSSPRAGGGHRVLVGKGITFDSGGLSLKPAGSMVGMKTDMAGAAAVLGAMTALPALGVPGRVTGLLCLAENMIGGGAMRPGDVITCWGGMTVEVLNTDAEGRLVLADALAYAASELDADAIVDLATLTGAVGVALGRRTAGLFSTDDALAAALTAAAGAAGEQVWRLPLTEDYRPALDSPVADLANIGRALDVGGGSITAALFLREFVGARPWAHLDIAGTARADADDGEISRGATGWGVRTLLSWLTAPAQTSVQPVPGGPVVV